MSEKRIDLPQGTLDLLILKTLALDRQHGSGIADRVAQISNAVVQVPQGSLYPALHRLEQRGWIKADWGVSENNRKAKYYALTRAGQKQLETGTEDWRKLAIAIGQVLDTS
jgi:PadR family transcriptional regulator PadR